MYPENVIKIQQFDLCKNFQIHVFLTANRKGGKKTLKLPILILCPPTDARKTRSFSVSNKVDFDNLTRRK